MPEQRQLRIGNADEDGHRGIFGLAHVDAELYGGEPVGTERPRRSGRSRWSDRTYLTLRPWFAGRSGRTLRTLRTYGACCTCSTGLTSRSLLSGLTLLSGGTRPALCAPRALRSSSALRTCRSWRSLCAGRS